MYVVKALATTVGQHGARWLVKGPGASWVIAGTFALAGVSAAALNAPAHASNSGVSTTSVTYPGCWADPDGDGHIFCDSSVTISNLPAAFGFCSDRYDGNIVCEGQDR